MKLTRIKNLSYFESPYTIKELSKHIDPIILKDLGKIQIDTYKKMQLTIVFWDISGFSQMCKDLNDYPDDVISFLKGYFEIAIKSIKKHDGVLDKFIGDGILAYFGYKSADRNGDPHNAINAALELKNKFAKFKQEYIKFCNKYNGKNPNNINLRCGMHNGQTFLHYFSSHDRNNVIILGSTVNLASRLEGLAKNDEIIISNQVKNMVQNVFNFNTIEIKDRISGKTHDGKIKTFEDETIVYDVIGRK